MISASDIDDGGSAFPRIGQEDEFRNEVVAPAPGITIRDYFAAKAMAATITPYMKTKSPQQSGADAAATVAEAAYEIADAMLKARQA